MSLTEGLPHIFRKRTLQRLLAQSELDGAQDEERTPAAESFTEGSVLFEDADEDFEVTSSRTLLMNSNGASTLYDPAPFDLSGRGVKLFPPEPALPAKVKELKWVRVMASCVVVASNGVQYSLSQVSRPPARPFSLALCLTRSRLRPPSSLPT